MFNLLWQLPWKDHIFFHFCKETWREKYQPVDEEDALAKALELSRIEYERKHQAVSWFKTNVITLVKLNFEED